MRQRVRSTVLGLLVAGGGVYAAHADTITAVSSASALGANDQVSWSQFNGQQAGFVGGYFVAFSDNSYEVDGAFAHAESQNRIFSQEGRADSTTLRTYGYGPGFGGGLINDGGPVTFTVGGVSAVGATISSPAAFSYGFNFTASLTLYNGSTTIGTVSGSSDNAGQPFFLGAVDTSGQNITGFTYQVTSIASSDPYNYYYHTYPDAYGHDLDDFNLSALQLTVSGSTKWRGVKAPKACVSTKPASFATSTP